MYTDHSSRRPHPATQRDPLWLRDDYRIVADVAHDAWPDVVRLMRCAATRGVAGPLYRALGSIVANVAEDYRRRSGADRARMFEYAPGSARESREWYQLARPVLGDARVDHTIVILSRLVSLLAGSIRYFRNSPRIGYPPKPEARAGQ